MRKTHRLRLVLLIVLSTATFGLIELRLYDLQIRQHPLFAGRAEYQQHKMVRLSPRRGDILDRNGRLLASSHFTETIVLDTRQFDGKPHPRAIRDLAGALGKPADLVGGYFERPNRHYVYRKAPEEVVQAVTAVAARHNLPDGLVELETASKRDYPNNSLASHLLGFTTIDDSGSDNIGLAGVEQQYNEWLAGNYREVRLLVSGSLRRRGLSALNDDAIQDTFGHALELTLDQRIQMLTESALNKAVGSYQAQGGVAIVLDVPTGEILALANCPDFNLSTFRNEKIEQGQLRNRALTDPVEVGSVMKIFTTAMLLDGGLVSPAEMVDAHDGSIDLHGRLIKDDHRLGVVPFRTAFALSSNIVMASLADSRLEPQVQYAGLRRFGFGAPTGLDLPGEGAGLLRPVRQWTVMSPGSLAIGYEIGVTPLQVVDALAAIGNNGWRMRPHLLRAIRNAKGQTIQQVRPESLGRVAGPETCKTLLSLMELVVTEGTAEGRADVAGYRVGGKTGTSVKHSPDAAGRKRFFASFAGLAPLDNPRLAIVVCIDEPHGGKYGGQVAAPVFSEICEQALPLLEIPPSDPNAYQEALIARRQTSPEAILAAARKDAESPAAAPAEANLPPETTQRDPLPVLPGMELEVAQAGRRMPDCRGLTMLEAWEKLAQAGIDAHLLGSGVAVGQEPAPGAPLLKGPRPKVIFSSAAVAETVVKTSGAPLAIKVR